VVAAANSEEAYVTGSCWYVRLYIPLRIHNRQHGAYCKAKGAHWHFVLCICKVHLEKHLHLT
jgi:hypothetical protein